MSLLAAAYTRISDFLSFYWSISILVQMIVPIVMLTYQLPKRPHAGARVTLTFGLLLVGSILPLATGLVTGLTASQSFIVFSALLVVFVIFILFVYDVSTQTALFCATSAYTLQNLSSGLSLLFQMLITRSQTSAYEHPVLQLIDWLVPIAIYAGGYVVFVRTVGRNGLLGVNNRAMLLMLAVVAVAIIGFDTLIKSIVFDQVSYMHMILLRCVHALICLFVLFVEYELLFAQKMRDEKKVAEALLAERDRQYQLSRKNIEAINIKCHDIRHQIRMIAEGSGQAAPSQGVLDDIAAEVSIYDAVVETGNEALDTILTEKSLECSSKHITLSIIADGAALGFMEPSDIYSLFGNALDNAIEATSLVESPEHRTIMFNVRRQGGMVAVNMENYCATKPEFEDGIPQTTKGDPINHGFGTKSIRNTTMSYGGTFHAGMHDDVFYLNLLLPAAE